MTDTVATVSGEQEQPRQQQVGATQEVAEALAHLNIGAAATAIAVEEDERVVVVAVHRQDNTDNTKSALLEIAAEATLSTASSSSETTFDPNAVEIETPELAVVSSDEDRPLLPDDPLQFTGESSVQFEAFSDAELIAALQTLGIDDDDNDDDGKSEYSNDPLDFPSSSADLPELEFNGDDDPLFVSFQADGDENNFDDVFDENQDDDDDEEQEPLDPALDILEQLEQLTLLDGENHDEGSWLQPFQEPTPRQQQQQKHQTTTPLNRTESTTALTGLKISTLDEEEEEALIYYCQPCNSPSSIPPPADLPYSEEQAWALAAAAVLAEQLENEGIEDREEDAAFWREQIRLLTSGGLPTPLSARNSSNHHPPDPFELLHLEPDDIMTADEPEPVVTPSAAAGEEPAASSGRVREPEPTQQRLSLHPGALRAAQPFATAFATDLAVECAEERDPSSQRRVAPQRECLGHKERVLGCDFSSCGKYLATASQDSTVRVWSTATHKELAVIREHSTEHECLRVAWASATWAHGQIQRRTVRGEPTQSHAYLLATGGADGVVHLWGCDTPENGTWTNYATLDHSTYRHVKERSPKAPDGGLEKAEEAEGEEAGSDEDKDELDEDRPQIYSLQFVDHWTALPTRSKAIGDAAGGDDDEGKATNLSNSFLLTSSDDHVHIWEIDEAKLNKKTKAADGTVSKQLQLREVLSLRFGTLNGPASGVTLSSVTENGMLAGGEQQHLLQQHDSMCPKNAGNRFGGDRNPENVVFVFDASYCPANGLLGAALSDGSLRLMNGRGVCLSVLQLPGCQSHLTSFSWDSTGERLATTVATGHLITWGIELINTLGSHGPNDHHSLVSEGIRASCRAVMEGGHARGRPLYGTRYLENDDLLISWGGDGRVCLWDSRSGAEIDGPLAVLWDNNNDKTGEGYPVYALAVTRKTVVESSDGNIDSEGSKNNSMLSIAIAGGGTTGGFLGIPVYLQDVHHLPDDGEEEVQGDAKRPKQGIE